MFAKIVKYTFWIGLALVALLIVTSLIAGYVLGRDVDTASLGAGTAKRDSEGVWEIHAPDPDSLWQNLGYIQAHDRYFQIELVRHAALGRLSELFGDEAVSRDRLGRMIAGVAYDAFQKEGSDSLVVRSAAAFASGIEAWRQSELQSDPVELRMVGLRNADLPKWEAWHIYAITYYQSWMFSYDLTDENRGTQLRKVKGEAWTNFFDRKENIIPESHMYAQPSVRGNLRKPANGFAPELLASVLKAPGVSQLHDLFGIGPATPVTKEAKVWPPIPGEVQLGASNAWLAFHPQRAIGPLLCNDPHLQLMWPSALYPIKYSLKKSASESLKVQGWMLPGQPLVVSGGMESATKIFAWGVTLANYANTQERVVLSPADLAVASKHEVKIKVRDAQTGVAKVVSFQERWTRRGPVASDWFDHETGDETVWAADWIGFRGAQPPYRYFIESNLNIPSEIPTRLATEWQMPAFNVHWLQKDKAQKNSNWGHLTTGAIFETRSGGAVGISVPRQRSYFSADSRSSEISFLASGNQQIWSDLESQRLARQWGMPLRAQQIGNHIEKNFNEVGYSQTDAHSLLTHGFLKWARRELGANDLCTSGDSDAFSRCQQDLSQLDGWAGQMDAGDWRPTLVALWLSQLKWRLWILKDASVRGKEISYRSERELKLFVDWSRSTSGQKLSWALFHDPKFARELKEKFNLNLKDLLRSSFVESQEMLELSLGVDRSLWKWENLHRVAWQHPLLKLLGPNLPFLGPPMSGADDSPLRASWEWDPRFPLLFPVVHGAVARTCFDASGDHLKVKWTATSGPSGNPFSKWSKSFSEAYYFAGRWVEGTFFEPTKETPQP